MYRAFNLTDLANFEELERIDKNTAQADYDYHKQQVTKNLSISRVLREAIIARRNGDQIKIDADQIQQNIFPNYKKYDVFISHSHQDLELVQKFAYYLRNTLGLKVFIDSEVWGYVDDLLMSVNNQYAKIGEKLYDYKKCNLNASVIYLMLSNAIHDVINETECLFFINTPNSINSEENIEETTESPWIYDELKTTSIIKPKIPDRIQAMIDVYKIQQKSSQNVIVDSAEPVWIRDVTKEVNSLEVLPNRILVEWQNKYELDRTHDALVEFYLILFNIK